MTRVAVFPELVSCEVVESTQFHLAPLAPCLQYISAVLGFELQCCGLVGMCLYKSLYSVINGTWWTPGGGGGGGGEGGLDGAAYYVHVFKVTRAGPFSWRQMNLPAVKLECRCKTALLLLL